MNTEKQSPSPAPQPEASDVEVEQEIRSMVAAKLTLAVNPFESIVHSFMWRYKEQAKHTASLRATVTEFKEKLDACENCLIDAETERDMQQAYAEDLKKQVDSLSNPREADVETIKREIIAAGLLHDTCEQQDKIAIHFSRRESTLRATVSGLQVESKVWKDYLNSANNTIVEHVATIASQAERLNSIAKSLFPKGHDHEPTCTKPDGTCECFINALKQLTAARLEADAHAKRIVELFEKITFLESACSKWEQSDERLQGEFATLRNQLTSAQADIKRKETALKLYSNEWFEVKGGWHPTNTLMSDEGNAAKAALSPAQPAEVSPVTTGEQALRTQLVALANAVDVLAAARTPMQRIKATRPLDEALKSSRALLGNEKQP